MMPKFSNATINKTMWDLYKLDFLEFSIGEKGQRIRFTPNYMAFVSELKKHFADILEKELRTARESQSAKCLTTEIRDCVGYLCYNERMEETAYNRVFPGTFSAVCMDFVKQFRIEVLRNLDKGITDRDNVLKYSISVAVASTLTEKKDVTLKTGEIYNSSQKAMDDIIEDMKKIKANELSLQKQSFP